MSSQAVKRESGVVRLRKEPVLYTCLSVLASKALSHPKGRFAVLKTFRRPKALLVHCSLVPILSCVCSLYTLCLVFRAFVGTSDVGATKFQIPTQIPGCKWKMHFIKLRF